MSSMTGNTVMKSGSGRTGNKVPKGTRVGQIQQYTPEQMQLFGQGLENVGPESYLSRLAGGDQDIFNQIESPALQQFSELQGGLASRFSGGGGKGSLGSRKSSGFQNTQNQAASQFAQQLQANRQQLQQQAIKDLHGMSQDLLGNRPYQQFTYDKPEKEGFNWGGAAGALGGGALGFFAGGPMGAIQGASMGYGVGSQF